MLPHWIPRPTTLLADLTGVSGFLYPLLGLILVFKGILWRFSSHCGPPLLNRQIMFGKSGLFCLWTHFSVWPPYFSIRSRLLLLSTTGKGKSDIWADSTICLWPNPPCFTKAQSFRKGLLIQDLSIPLGSACVSHPNPNQGKDRPSSIQMLRPIATPIS